MRGLRLYYRLRCITRIVNFFNLHLLLLFLYIGINRFLWLLAALVLLDSAPVLYSVLRLAVGGDVTWRGKWGLVVSTAITIAFIVLTGFTVEKYSLPVSNKPIVLFSALASGLIACVNSLLLFIESAGYLDYARLKGVSDLFTHYSIFLFLAYLYAMLGGVPL